MAVAQGIATPRAARQLTRTHTPTEFPPASGLRKRGATAPLDMTPVKQSTKRRCIGLLDMEVGKQTQSLASQTSAMDLVPTIAPMHTLTAATKLAPNVLPHHVGDANIVKASSALDEFELSLLSTLFAEIDAAMHLYALRNKCFLLPQIREAVEMKTRRSLSDTRLAKILGVSNGMLTVRWNTFHGSIEMHQVVAGSEDNKKMHGQAGEVRTPTSEELPLRRIAFDAALTRARSVGCIPTVELPKAPPRQPPLRWPTPQIEKSHTSSEVANDQNKGPKLVSERNIERISQPASACSRFEQLRARVLARVAFESGPVARATAEVKRKLKLCENALVLHAIVSQLFIRNERNDSVSNILKASPAANTGAGFPGVAVASSTSEVEVMIAATSQSFALQTLRRVEAVGVKDALAHLTTYSHEWFYVVEGVLNVGAKYLRRRVGGSSIGALEALEIERRTLHSLLFDLQSGSTELREAAVKTILALKPEDVDLQLKSQGSSASTVPKMTAESKAVTDTGIQASAPVVIDRVAEKTAATKVSMRNVVAREVVAKKDVAKAKGKAAAKKGGKK